MSDRLRCDWVRSELSAVYHDTEWGIPQHDDRKLFEMLVLEGMQAGLSWEIVLKRRESMREAFDGFDPQAIAGYDAKKQQELLLNPGVIRNRLKIASLPINAQAFLKAQGQYGSFDSFIWQFVGGKPIINRFESSSQLPTEDAHSKQMSKELKKRGFKFVGSTICYAFMQAVGMVDDHTIWCHRHSTNRGA